MVATWRWLSTKPNGILAALTALQRPGDEDAEKTPTLTELPAAIRGVVVVMELTLVSGSAFLLLLSSSVFGAFARSLSDNNVVSCICEASAFGWGLLTFMSWFFQLPKREFERRLTRFGWSGVTACLVSVLLHAGAVMSFTLWDEDQVLVTWKNVETAVRQSDGSVATVEIIQNLLLAPMKEELFFRGVIVLMSINRLRSLKWSAWISSVLFAAIHLVNVRRIGSHYSMSYVAFQVLWAWLVGLFLALKLAVSGSLVQCLTLHAINNMFALGVSKTHAMDFTQPTVSCSVIIALAIYAVAIARQLQILSNNNKAGLKDI
ncbi:CPBP intramembrane metalloprotease domain-containing protein [Phytophthora infestans]|uniref:CPBP intramembrane metalloprotease domain-containing protein n=1 Tax=Phytophthora infestans TaxID=4787 RepID=A0A833W3R7_PHYIN|nr:CPBP intramembrane metalloprotease domain-containing protein [Phytophthora infestans]